MADNFKQKVDYEKIVDLLPFYIVLVDKNDVMQFINKVASYENIDDYTGKKLKDVLPAEVYKQYSKAIKAVFETGQATQVDIDLQDPKWKNRLFTIHLIPYKNKKNEVTQVLAANVDSKRLIDQIHRAELSELKYRTIIENTPDPVIQIDENLNITYHNWILKYEGDKSDVIGKSIFHFVDGGHKTILEKNIEKARTTGKAQEYEIEQYSRNNIVRWYHSHCSPIFENNKNKGFIIHCIDITEKKLEQLKTEEFNQKLEELVAERTKELEKANNEINVLLKEMHHRVKNNLQIVSSLLNLQRSYVNKDTQEILMLSQDRIRSMALVHEMLYKSKNLSAINLGEYITLLISNILLNSFDKKLIERSIAIQTKKKELDIDKMIPIGLLINELLTNSIKHAFYNTDNPFISIEVIDIPEGTHNMQLIYKDNGSGMTKSEAKNTLGTELIECFVEQLNGKYQSESAEQGVCYEIFFKA